MNLPARHYTLSRLDPTVGFGAGHRIASGYFREIFPGSHYGLYWEERKSQEGLPAARSYLIPNRISAIFKWSLGQFATRDTVLLLPDSIADCAYMLPFLLTHRNCLLWMMDNFPKAELAQANWYRRPFKWFLFSIFYFLAKKRIVISKALGEALASTYGPKKYTVIPPIKRHKALARENLSRRPVWHKWIYLGNLKEPYIEPLLALQEQGIGDLGVQIDVYGMEAPRDPRLSSELIRFKGPFKEEDKAKILSQYDFALLSYSFDKRTRNLYSSSFPSKLVDYLSAGLNVISILPEEFFIAKVLKHRKIGPVCTGVDRSDIVGLLTGIEQELENHFEERAEAAREWVGELSFDRYLEELKTLIL